MARRYDSRTTIFSPEGRLYQVEYAMEAISHAGTCVGIEANDGVVLVAECRNTNKLLDNDVFNDKIYKIADHICCAVAGITADANVLTNEMRYIAQRYELNYGEPIPVEQLVSHLCDIKQAYTQYGGKRPFGVSILYMGWDKHKKFQLYQSDPSGNCSGWTATCIGSNFGAAIAMLKSELDKKQLSLLETELLGIKVLGKSFDSATITAEKVEMATLSLEVDQAGNQATKIKILKRDEVAELVKKVLAQTSQESESRS